MTEAARLPTKEITGFGWRLYKLASVSDTNTLTTDFGTAHAVFISSTSGNPTYISYTVSGGTITFETPMTCNLDVLVWGE